MSPIHESSGSGFPSVIHTLPLLALQQKTEQQFQSQYLGTAVKTIFNKVMNILESDLEQVTIFSLHFSFFISEVTAITSI